MNKRVIWLITIVLSLSVVCLIVVQTYWIKNAISVKKDQFQDLIYRSLNDVSKVIRELETENSSLNQGASGSLYEEQLTNEIEDAFANTPKLIDIEYESVIKSQLSNRGIKLSFEWAIVDDMQNAQFSSAQFKSSTEMQKYTVQLFAHDLMSNPYMLVVYFPNQKHFFFESLGFMASSTLGLTFIIILCFSATSYIIFRQKKISEIKSDFISNMTHELKTPISTISLASQMLGDPSIDPQQKNVKNLTDLITKETKKLGFQVERVLQMATFDEKRMDFKLEPHELLHLLQNAMKDIRLQVESKKGKLNFQNNDDSTLVNIDALHITSVLSNLMDNALKYSTEMIKIEVELFNEGDWVCCSFRDHGIGIAKDNLKRVFEKFYRVPSGNVHNVKGFGLGLSYVKKVVEGHGGKVTIESELNEGSVFTIKLPLLKA